MPHLRYRRRHLHQARLTRPPHLIGVPTYPWAEISMTRLMQERWGDELFSSHDSLGMPRNSSCNDMSDGGEEDDDGEPTHEKFV
jgi:hypothetical protein